MRRIETISLALIAVLAASILTAGTAAASPKTLNLYEGQGPEFEPGAAIVISLYGLVTFVTPAGYVECIGEDGESSVSYGDREHGVWDAMAGANTISAIFTTPPLENLPPDPCNSSLDLGGPAFEIGPAEQFTLNGNGKATIAGLTAAVQFSGGAHCGFSSALSKAKFAVSPARVPLSIAVSGQKLTRIDGSSPICPRTTKLYADFHATTMLRTPIFDSN